MYSRRVTGVVLAVILSLQLISAASARIWTSKSGKYTVEAEYVELKDGKVTLKTADGRTIRVPLEKLSVADQRYAHLLASHAPKVINGKVMAVSDGDTFIVVVGDKKQHTVRMQGIDAPERDQPGFAGARQALSTNLFRKTVRIEWKDKDRYRRVLGDVYIEDQWINKLLVAEGWAWHYKKHSEDEELAAAEAEARKRRVGVWKEKSPIAPWDWRDGKRPPPKVVARPPPPPVATPAPPPKPASPTVYVTRTGSKYHRSSCRYLRKSRIPISLAEAIARYGACKVCRPP